MSESTFEYRRGLPSVFSADGPIFGREQEASAFRDVLGSAAETGMTVLTIGQVGMGKSALLRRFAQVAKAHPDLDCTVQHFYLREQDDPATFLDTLVHETFGMARAADGRSRLAGPNWKQQVSALFGIVNADKLFESLFGQEWNPSWQRLLALFTQLSEKMDPSRRVVFFIDPLKYLRPDSGSAWLAVAERLPPKFVLVFAQRPDDALARYPDFRGPKIRRIPEEMLQELDPRGAEEFIQKGIGELGIDPVPAAEALRRYNRWPYAIQAGLVFLKHGGSPADMPADPDQLTGRLLERLSTSAAREGSLVLVYALAILGIPVPMALLTAFLEQPSSRIRAVLHDPSVVGLINKRQDGFELFHSLFVDRVRAQIKEDGEWVRLHDKAVRLFETRLAEDARDELALRRLAIHVREAHGHARYFATVKQLLEQKRLIGMFADTISELEAALQHAPEPKMRANFLGNLGILYSSRGDLDAAETMYQKALAIYEELGDRWGTASSCGNLGLLSATRGDLNAAEAMYQKSLAIHQELGQKEGMAIQFNNMANLSTTRGDLDAAETMYQKALTINVELGHKQGMASNYGNLGRVLFDRGDLDAAETMYQKALTINEELGRKEGMAIQFNNLGSLSLARNELDAAETMYRKALALDEELGRQGGVASCYGNLGNVFMARGELDAAETMYRKALALDEELGRKDQMALARVHLGRLSATRGDLDAAEEMWKESLALFQRLGMPLQVREIQLWLLDLEKKRSSE